MEIMGSVRVLAMEMETAELYTLAAKYGRKALSILTVSDHIATGEAPQRRRKTKYLFTNDETGIGNRLIKLRLSKRAALVYRNNYGIDVFIQLDLSNDEEIILVTSALFFASC